MVAAWVIVSSYSGTPVVTSQHPRHLPGKHSLCYTHAPGDETLRFWNVFPGAKSQGSVNDSSVGSMMRTHIR